MAEMTAAEAIECLQQNIHYYEDPFVDVDKLIIKLIEQQAAEIEQARATIDTHSELAEHYKRRAEQVERENKRLRVCGNCRHFSTGYTESYCVKANNRETMRDNTCRDWEMV